MQTGCPGVPLQNDWSDIKPASGKERLGYPTQKPLALLERIIASSTNRRDVVLDAFCGCGTTLHAAEKLGRAWIGIDISIHAIRVIEARLRDAFGPSAVPPPQGIPSDYESAAALARDNPYQFQWWANYLVGAQQMREKKGADRGIDGNLFFPMGPGRDYGRMIISVKSGRNINPAQVRELRGTVEREGAEMGLFVCLDPPSEAMRRDALAAGYVNTPQGRLQKLQIMSVADYFSGREHPDIPRAPDMPAAAFARPKVDRKSKRPRPEQSELPLSFVGGKKRNEMTHLNPIKVQGAIQAMTSARSRS